jgi:DNA-binding MarR family transcriptional regulator
MTQSISSTTAAQDPMVFLGAWTRRLADVMSVQGEALLTRTGAVAPAFGLSVFMELAVGDGLSAADVCQRLGQSHQRVTHIIDRLVALDLVERVVSPKDRRMKVLILTEAGQADLPRVESALKLVREAVEDLCREVGWDDVEKIGQMVTALGRKSLGERV